MLVLNAEDVRAHLTPAVALGAAKTAFRALRDEATHQPVRTAVDAPGIDGLTLLKPAAVDGGYGLKVVSLFPGNLGRGLDQVQGFVALLDAETGIPDAILDAAVVTEIRTAAASALATDVLAPATAGRLGLLGAGVQARSHLLSLRDVRPVEQVLVWSPRRAPAFVEWAREQGISAVATTAEEVVRSSDLICTVTTSTTPVLLGEWLSPGTHVNAVGAFRPRERELDTRAVARATVFVDARESAAAEAGALLLAREEGLEVEVAELTDVLCGRHPGRTSNDEITLFSSTGLAVQDVAAAKAAVAAARAAGAGVEVAFP